MTFTCDSQPTCTTTTTTLPSYGEADRIARNAMDYMKRFRTLKRLSEHLDTTVLPTVASVSAGFLDGGGGKLVGLAALGMSTQVVGPRADSSIHESSEAC